MKIIDYFGIDLGHSTVKSVQLRTDSKNFFSVNESFVTTPKNSIGSENEQDRMELIGAIKSGVKELQTKFKKVCVSIPENFVSSRLIQIPYMEDSQIAEAIHWQAKQYIPIPLDEVNLSYRKVGESYSSDGVRMWNIFIVAVSKTLVNYYIRLFKDCGLQIVAIETAAASLSRPFLIPEDKTTSVILDIGFDSSTLAVIRNSELIYSQSISTGSNSMTKAVMQDFGLEYAQAEEYKKNYGLDESQLDGRIYRSIKLVVDSICTDVTRAIEYFKINAPDSIPSRVIVTGGGCNLPGLVVYLTQIFGIEVQIGNPWVNVKDTHEDKNKSIQNTFSIALGLAMKTKEL